MATNLKELIKDEPSDSDTPAPGSPSEEELLKWWGPEAAEAAANASAEMMQKAANDALDEIRGFAPISPTEPFPVCENDTLFGGGSVEIPDDEMSDEEEEEEEEEEAMDEEEDEDTRPLITPRWRQENSEEWDRLWILNMTEECPVCQEKPDIWDGPMNSDVASRCTHWACVSCWARIAERDKRCPVCRDDLSVWLARHEHRQ